MSDPKRTYVGRSTAIALFAAGVLVGLAVGRWFFATNSLDSMRALDQLDASPARIQSNSEAGEAMLATDQATRAERIATPKPPSSRRSTAGDVEEPAAPLAPADGAPTIDVNVAILLADGSLARERGRGHGHARGSR